MSNETAEVCEDTSSSSSFSRLCWHQAQSVPEIKYLLINDTANPPATASKNSPIFQYPGEKIKMLRLTFVTLVIRCRITGEYTSTITLRATTCFGFR